MKWKETRIIEQEWKSIPYSFLPQHLRFIGSALSTRDGVVIDWLLGNYFDARIEETFIREMRVMTRQERSKKQVGSTFTATCLGSQDTRTCFARSSAGRSCFYGLVCVGVGLDWRVYPFPNGGALLTATIVLYALTSGISGYVASNMYRQMGGKKW